MSKILTISVAAYNVENYISNTLESLLVDDIDDIEILVEDDGGIDNTANIVKEYEEKYPNVQAIKITAIYLPKETCHLTF